MQFGDKFILMFETFDLDFEQPEMQAILNDEMCHCFNIWPPVPESQISFLVENKKYSAALFMPASTVMLGNLQKHTSAGKNCEPTVAFALEEIRKLDELQNAIDGDVYWIAFPECDSSDLPVYIYENRIRYENRLDAYEKIMSYFMNWDILRNVNKEKRKYKIMGIAGHPGTIQMLCEMGMDSCLTEMCISALYDIHPTISMTRGVCRQYGKTWGLDFSHWTTYAGPIIYDDNGKRISGWSESYWERNLYIAYLSGANIMRIEEVAARFAATKTADAGKNFCFILDSDQKVKLTPIGKVLKKFSDFTAQKLEDRGETYVPVAFMTEKHSGWNPKSSFNKYNTVWGKQFPYNSGDYMSNHFMNLVYEGHHKHGSIEGAPYAIRRNYDDCCWEFTEKNKAGKLASQLIGDGFDTRPFEPLSSAVYGDSFDFITTDADNITTGRYKLIIPLGKIDFSEKTRDVITKFVVDGGTVVLNAEEASQWSREFTGVEISEHTAESCVSKCLICGMCYDKYFSYKTGNNSEVWYEYSEMKALTAEIRAVNDRNDPLITANSHGKGKVYVMAPLYASCITDRSLMCKISEHFFRHLMDSFITVKISPMDLSFTLNENNDGYILGLFNNNNFDWTGQIEITMTNPDSKISIQSLTSAKRNFAVCGYDGDSLVIKGSIDKFEFDILKIKRGDLHENV